MKFIHKAFAAFGIAALSTGISMPVVSAETVEVAKPSAAVEQLRHTIGSWDVETDFIGADGKLLGTIKGRYDFQWVVEDQIVSGTSDLPALKQRSAILFFLRAKPKEVEMLSVGADGQVWRMIGPQDSEVRTTPNVAMDGGSTLMLRFTRHSVEPDSFGSTMEMSSDGGENWRIGNQQRFKRKSGNQTEN